MSLRHRTLATLAMTGLVTSGLTGLAGIAHAGTTSSTGRDPGYSLSCQDGKAVARATARHTRVQLKGGSLGRTSSVESKDKTLRLRVVTKRDEKRHNVANPCAERGRPTRVWAAKPTFTDKCGTENDRVRFRWTKGVDYYLDGEKVTRFDRDLEAEPGDEIRVKAWRGYRLARDSYTGGEVELTDKRCERPRPQHRIVKAEAPKTTDNCGTDKDTVRFRWTRGVDYYLNGEKVKRFDADLKTRPGDRVVVEAWRGHRLARDSYRGGNLDLTDKPCEAPKPKEAKAVAPETKDECGTDKDTVRFPRIEGVDYFLNGRPVHRHREAKGVNGAVVTVKAEDGWVLAKDSYTGSTLTFTDKPCEAPKA